MNELPPDRDELDRDLRRVFVEARTPGAPDSLRASLERVPSAVGRPSATSGRSLGLASAAVAVVAVGLVGALLASRVQSPAAGSPPATGAGPSAIAPGGTAVPTGPSASPVAVVPWVAATPPPQPGLPTARPVPPRTKACTAADLAATADWQGATGSMAGGIVVTNVGPTACAVDGPPKLVVIDAGKTTMPTAYTGATGPGPESTAPPGPGLLEPGEHGTWWLFWTNWCGPDLVPTAVTVTLADGSGVVAGPEPSSTGPGIGGTPRCDAAGDPSPLTVMAFVSLPPEGPIPAGQVASTTITAPATAKAGQDVTFTVALTNRGDGPAVFEPCPTYSEDLIVGGQRLKPPADQHFAMFCAAFPTELAPGATIVLEMHYPIPSHVPPGSVELLWSMDPGGPFDTGAFGRVPIEIVGAE